MSKRILSWILSCALLLSCISGLTLVTSADESDVLTLSLPNNAVLAEKDGKACIVMEKTFVPLRWTKGVLTNLLGLAPTDIIDLEVKIDYFGDGTNGGNWWKPNSYDAEGGSAPNWDGSNPHDAGFGTLDNYGMVSGEWATVTIQQQARKFFQDNNDFDDFSIEFGALDGKFYISRIEISVTKEDGTKKTAVGENFSVTPVEVGKETTLTHNQLAFMTGSCRNEGGNIGFTGAGSALSYVIDVKEAGKYTAVLSMANGNGTDGKIQLTDGGETLYGEAFVVPGEQGNWGGYKDYTVEGIELAAGVQTLSITFVENAANYASIKLTKVEERYTLDGATTSNLDDGANGEIDVIEIDGKNYYVWKFAGSDNKWIGIGDANGILNDSTSVTYEYDVLFDTENGNDRCFLTYGTTEGWKGVNDKSDSPDFNGYAAHGNWLPTPAMGAWGTITMVNDKYSPATLNDNCITRLGSWVTNGTLYVKAIRAYDTNDKTKMISLTFNEVIDDGTVDKTALEAAIAEGATLEGKTTASVAAYNKALDAAKEVVANEEATQIMVNAALKALNAAKAALKDILTVGSEETTINCTDVAFMTGNCVLENGNTNIGFINQGDYLDFEVNVTQGNKFMVVMSMGTGNSDATVELRDGNDAVKGSVVVPQSKNEDGSGKWGEYNEYTLAEKVSLEAGVQTLRVYFAQSSANFQWMKLIPEKVVQLPDPELVNGGSFEEKDGKRVMSFVGPKEGESGFGAGFNYTKGTLATLFGLTEEDLVTLDITMDYYWDRAVENESGNNWWQLKTYDKDGLSAPNAQWYIDPEHQDANVHGDGFGLFTQYGMTAGSWNTLKLNSRPEQAFNKGGEDFGVWIGDLNRADVHVAGIKIVATKADGTTITGIWGTVAEIDNSALKAEVNAAVDTSMYTADSAKAYTDALDVAKAVLENSSNQAEIDAALEALIAAKAALVVDTWDLIVVDITTDKGKAPAVGETVKFVVTVKNIGTKEIPAGSLYGGVVNVNGAFAGWSDTLKDGSAPALAPGATIVLTTNGGGANNDGTWVVIEGSYKVSFQVNDNPSNGIQNEASMDNNTLEVTLPGVDTAALQAEVNAAIEDLTIYTDESAAEYTEALTAAKAMLEKADATQEEVNAALKALTDAKAALVAKAPVGEELQLGDVNFDGAVDSSDARIVLQAAVKKIELTAKEKAVANVDDVEAIDSSDARVILQVAVKKAELGKVTWTEEA